MAVTWAAPIADRAEDRSGARERHRRRVVRLIFLTYVVFLIEGMLRKWVLPGLSEPLYFIRDPFVLAACLIAFKHGLVRVRGWFMIWIMVAAVTSVFGILMLALNGVGLVAGLLGVRSYWLYMPLAFVVADCVEKEDLFRFARLNLMLAIPVCLLVLAQYRSSPHAFINQGVGSDAPAETVVGDIVRPYGLFTYTTQHVTYVASLLALAALGWIMRAEMRIRPVVLGAASLAVLVMALTTGSRSIYFFGMQVALVLALLALVSGRQRERGRAILFLVLACIVGAGLFATVLNPTLDAMLARHIGAERVEGSVFLRALGILTSFTGILGEVPLLGYGIGAGTSTVAAWTGGILKFGAYENELERLIQELGPLVGLGLIAVRSTFTVALLLGALRAASAGNSAGLVLFGFVGAIMLVGQITFTTIVGFLGWLYVGLVLAMSRTSPEDRQPRQPVVPIRVQPARHRPKGRPIRRGTGA